MNRQTDLASRNPPRMLERRRDLPLHLPHGALIGNRNRIMLAAKNAFRSHIRKELPLAPFHKDGKQMVYGVRSRWHRQALAPLIPQLSPITRRNCPPPCSPSTQFGQVHTIHHRRLQLVEPAVIADLVVAILVALAIVAQYPDHSVELLVIRQNPAP